MKDADGNLSAPRAAVAKAIAALQGFEGTAGSDQMRAVTSALELLGYAYSVLTDENPAWS